MTPSPEGHPRGGWSRARMLRESLRWVHVPANGTVFGDGERLLVLLSAGGGASRVWRSNPQRGRAGALIRHTIEEARARGSTSLVWHTGEGVAPSFMDDLLLGRGFVMSGDLEVLAFVLGADPGPHLPELRVPPDVRVRTVEDATDLHRAHAVEAAAFPSFTPAEPDVRSYLLGLDALKTGERPAPADAPPNVTRAFRCLACVQDPPTGTWKTAATAGAEVAGETVRLWGAATLPGHRRRGAYRALVMGRCRRAHALGATLALAKANTSSAAVLKNAGFRPLAKERRYTLDLAAPDQPDDPRPRSA